MIRLRTASALAAGALAAVSIAGAALAAAIDDAPARTSASIASSTGPDGALLDDDPSPDDSTGSDDSTDPDGGFGPDDSAPDDSAAPADASATVSPTVGVETARLIALRSVGGGRVTSIERETEHGRLVYDVRVVLGGARHDLHVDRLTGTVLRHRVDGDSGGSTTSHSSDDSHNSDDDASHHRGRHSDDDDGHRGRGRGSDD